jgi:hypothetical protein
MTILLAIAMTVTLKLPKTSAPVLRLDGLEVRAGERMTIEVLDAKSRTVLGLAGLVGSNQADPHAPVETMNLVVPLNEKAARLMAKSGQITLTLRLRHPRRGASLKVKRVYFDTSAN